MAGSQAQGMQGRRADIIVIAAILGAAILALLIMQGRNALATEASAESSGPYAVVENTEGEYDVLPLSQDTSIVVTSSSGTNTITVSGGYVSVSDSDCKNRTCVKTGAKCAVGDAIICLPHQLVVQVVADPADASPVGASADASPVGASADASPASAAMGAARNS